MKLVFATNNKHKLEEVRRILPENIELLTLADIGCTEDLPETGNTLEYNAGQKARYIHDKYGYDCFADDSGLEVEALHGRPGVYSARYAGSNGNSSANMTKLLTELNKEENRKARFRTVIALMQNGETNFFEGEIVGEITLSERGANGFGYDPVFIPEGFQVTFAEMAPELKNRISHRAIAVKKLGEFLETINMK
ncbi:MAG: non-canonical purine NTP diphosphatase [Bacteroidota bacterium]